MGIIQIPFKKLHKNAVIPAKATNGAAGYDCVAVDIEYNHEQQYIAYKLGFAVAIPEGYVGLLYPRSSNRKTNVYVPNCVGVIDSDYRGEVSFTVKFVNDNVVITNDNKHIVELQTAELSPYIAPPYSVGDRVCQLIIQKLPDIHFMEIDALDETERGKGGHGSTGR